MGAISGSSPDLWLKADAITGLSDGSSVTTWPDSSGNSNHAGSGTSPVYKTGILNSLPVVRFNGSTQFLTSAASASAASQTVIALVNPSGTGFRTIRGASNSGAVLLRVDNSTNKLHADIQSIQAIADSSTTLTAGSWYLVVLTYTSGQASMRVNGVNDVYAVATGTPTTGRTTVVGARATGAEFFNGDMAELLSWSRRLDATEIAGVEAEIKAKWAITAVTQAAVTTITGTSSTDAGSGWEAWRLADGSIGGGSVSWSANATPPGWVKYQFSTAIGCASYKVTARSDAPNSAPSAWTFEGSNDNSTWTTLDTQSSQTWSASQTRTYTVTSSTAYLYYRMSITATQGGGSTWPSFSEWTIVQPNSSTLDAAVTLTASCTLTATASAAVFSGSAALSASTTLTADGYIGTPTVSAAASLTASSTLTATSAATRTASATLTATSVLSATAQATLVQATAALTAASVLTATPDPPKSSAAQAALYAASALFVEATSSTAASATLTASSTLTVDATAFTPWVEPNDPRTGRPQYRLIVAHRDGTRLGEITDATTSPIEDGVGTGATFSFTMATADPKMALIDVPATQAQVWRGTGISADLATAKPEFRGPMVKATDDKSGATTIDCRDPMWYLESGRRVIGAIPKRDLLVNGSFATGEPPWFGGFEPDSIPAAQPARSVIDVDFFGTRMKALQISGVDKVVTVTKEVKTEAVFVPNSATYLPGGDAAIRAVANLMPKSGTLQVRVDGYTADNRINGDPGDGMQLSKDRANAAAATIKSVRPNAVTTTAGHGYYDQIPGGQAANRRVVISWSGVQEASGHKQYEGQSLTVTQPVANKAFLPLTAVIWMKITKWIGPSKDGRGLYLQIVNPAKPSVVVDSGTFLVDDKTPRDRWIKLKATLENGVPPDGIAYQAQVRMYPPAGTALFTRGALYPGDQLGFFDVDQSLIIKGLVEHAQDVTLGWGDLGIGTRCQPTGFTRTREYPYAQRMQIDTAITEIAALYGAPEVVMEVTDSAQTVVTYHPRQGVATSEQLVHGGNVVGYEAPTDTRDAASSIILQADGTDDDREEGYARDVAALDGLLLAQVISTEGETPVTELEEGAAQALARAKHPRPAVWVTIDPARTGEVLAKIRQGDTARLVIDTAGIDGTYRRVKRRLHLSDVLELMLTPED